MSITQEEAEKRSLAVGFILIGKYINSKTKTEFQCPICKKIFNTATPNSIWCHTPKSCGHCNDPKINDNFGKLTIIKIIPNKSNGCSVEAKCQCGNIWTGQICKLKTGNTKSCGHCTDPKVGDKYNLFTIIKVCPTYNGGCQVDAQCQCGNIRSDNGYDIVNGKLKSCGKCGYQQKTISKTKRKDFTGQRFNSINILKPLYSNKNQKLFWQCKCDCGNVFQTIDFQKNKTCGHCNDPNIGDKFGRLTITTVIPSKNGNCSVVAQCACGKEWRGVASVIKKIKSCGNCLLMINGQNTSYKSLSLKHMLPLEAQHNFKYGKPNLKNHLRKSIDWAFIYQGKKVALEYDEWVWHGHKIIEDEKRYNDLVKSGWCVIRIRTHRYIPTQQQINQALELIRSGYKKISITLKGWGKGRTIADERKGKTTCL